MKTFSFDFAKAYQVFSAHPKKPIESCPCPSCVPAETLKNLSTLPLELINAADIARFLESAITTCGTKSDVQRLMPRILQIATEGSFGQRAVLLEHLKNALRQAEWLTWPQEEIEVIKKYFIAYFYSEPDNTILAQLLKDLGFLHTWPDLDTTQKILDHIALLFKEMIEQQAYNDDFVHSVYILNYLDMPIIIETVKSALTSMPQSIKLLADFAHHFLIVHTLFYQSLLDPILIKSLEHYYYSASLSAQESSYIADALELLHAQLKAK